MKILLINKFLYPNGGSETYVFKLGQELERLGHEVQYFGTDNPNNVVGNNMNAYVQSIDFHTKSKFSLIKNSFKTIYNKEARKKIKIVLNDFKPDVCHLNNFNYQLTPSIILEIKKWNKKCKIVYTAHDSQLVCPNHTLKKPTSGALCSECLGNRFINCYKNRCIHGSRTKSFFGYLEAKYWNKKNVYSMLDSIICCSNFMKSMLDSNQVLKDKTTVIHNFIDKTIIKENVKQGEYVLYFGRFSKEKGVETLVNVAKRLDNITFVFAGSGELDYLLNGVPNIRNIGFVTGAKLNRLISSAKFTICPSEWYENCPFSVMESLQFCTPVVGANIGGIPELISQGINGDLFESGNEDDLYNKITTLFYDTDRLNLYRKNCASTRLLSLEEYTTLLLKLYIS